MPPCAALYDRVVPPLEPLRTSALSPRTLIVSYHTHAAAAPTQTPVIATTTPLPRQLATTAVLSAGLGLAGLGPAASTAQAEPDGHGRGDKRGPACQPANPRAEGGVAAE